MSARRLRKDDTVMIIAGRERGKTGKVLRLLAEKDRVLIERVNMVKKHAKPRGVQQPGGIVEREASIHVSNVMIVSPDDDKPTRIGSKLLPDGERVRIGRRSGSRRGASGPRPGGG